MALQGGTVIDAVGSSQAASDDAASLDGSPSVVHMAPARLI
jgi:hypothetical protein